MRTIKEYKQWLVNFQELITTLQTTYNISDDALIYQGMMEGYIIVEGRETLDIDVDNKTITSRPNPLYVDNTSPYV